MAAPTLKVSEPIEAPESPLLGVFALLIVVAVVAISVMIAAPSVLTLALAVGTVMAFAVTVAYLLARMIGD